MLLSTNERLIAIDPGETTGICAMRHGKLVSATQLHTPDLESAYIQIHQYCATIFSQYGELQSPTKIVCEDYQVYAHKLRQHTWAGLHTPKVIGVCSAIAMQLGSEFVTRLASNPKGFITDEYLKSHILYVKGQKHARDAIRHAVYEIIYSNGKARTNSTQLSG